MRRLSQIQRPSGEAAASWTPFLQSSLFALVINCFLTRRELESCSQSCSAPVSFHRRYACLSWTTACCISWFHHRTAFGDGLLIGTVCCIKACSCVVSTETYLSISAGVRPVPGRGICFASSCSFLLSIFFQQSLVGNWLYSGLQLVIVVSKGR